MFHNTVAFFSDFGSTSHECKSEADDVLFTVSYSGFRVLTDTRGKLEEVDLGCFFLIQMKQELV